MPLNIQFTCSMQAQTQETIRNLQQAIAKDDSAPIYELSSSLLNQFPQDNEYKLCYVVSAIKLRKFQELANGIFKEKPADKKLEPLYAYFLYTSDQIEKCIDQISGCKDPSLRLLLAQAYFKTMNYARSAEIMT